MMALCVIMFSCSKDSPPDYLVGDWKSLKGTTPAEFSVSEDGFMCQFYPSEGWDCNKRWWSASDDNYIIFTGTSPSATWHIRDIGYRVMEITVTPADPDATPFILNMERQ